MPNGKTIKERVTSVETELRMFREDTKEHRDEEVKEFDKLNKNLSDILHNHLPHINISITELKDKVVFLNWKMALILGTGSMIGAAILTKLVDMLLAGVR